jgi:hypothetical protein
LSANPFGGYFLFARYLEINLLGVATTLGVHATTILTIILFNGQERNIGKLSATIIQVDYGSRGGKSIYQGD